MTWHKGTTPLDFGRITFRGGRFEPDAGLASTLRLALIPFPGILEIRQAVGMFVYPHPGRPFRPCAGAGEPALGPSKRQRRDETPKDSGV